MWFIFALIGYILLAIVFILDKYILTSAIVRPIVYTFYSTIFLLAVFLLWPFFSVPIPPTLTDLNWSIVSGFSFGLALYFMFVAVQKGEASHIDPFLGAVITIATAILSSVFLQEILVPLQITGIILLVGASLLLSWEKTRKKSGFHIGFLFAILSGIAFAFSHVSAKYLYDLYSFWPAFVLTRGAIGLFGLCLLVSPVVRHSFSTKQKKIVPKKKKSLQTPTLVIIDKVLSVVAILAIQFAIAIGSVTLVNAMSGLQYALMILIIYLCSRFAPQLFREYFTKKELVVESIALVLVILGMALLVV